MRKAMNKYLNYIVPYGWCSEEDNDTLSIYNPNGHGAITVSFFSIIHEKVHLDDSLSILAKKFIDKQNINLHSPLILSNKAGKTVLYGTGLTLDGWFLKLWVIAQYPKIAFATYQSECQTAEIKLCDSIIDSFQFTF